MPDIVVQNLSRNYDYYRKSPGLWGSVQALFHRERLTMQAVKDVSFSIESGEMVGFLGPNGAGKTTTLKMLSGILHPTSGHLTVLGHVPARREPAYQKQFALVMGQKNQLIWDLPALETFAVNRAIYEVPTKEFKRSLDELIGLFEIEEILDVQVRKLSLGQRMKCELVAALLHQPKVLFLDEPTIGLDVVAQKNIRDFLRRYNQRKRTTVLLTSHYMDDIRELCERVIIISSGRLMYDGNLESLIRQYAPDKRLKLVFAKKQVSRRALDRYGTVLDFSPYGATISVKRSHVKMIASQLLSSQLAIDDVMIEEVDVDDVIRHIFSAK